MHCTQHRPEQEWHPSTVGVLPDGRLSFSCPSRLLPCSVFSQIVREVSASVPLVFIQERRPAPCRTRAPILTSYPNLRMAESSPGLDTLRASSSRARPEPKPWGPPLPTLNAPDEMRATGTVLEEKACASFRSPGPSTSCAAPTPSRRATREMLSASGPGSGKWLIC